MASRRNRRRPICRTKRMLRGRRKGIASVPGAGGRHGREWRRAIRRLSWCWPFHFVVAVASVRREIEHVRRACPTSRPAISLLESPPTTIACSRRTAIYPQRWLTLPLLTLGRELSPDQASWAASDVWWIGDHFSFFDSGQDVEPLLRRARCMNILVSVGLGLLVYVWSRQLFGPAVE